MTWVARSGSLAPKVDGRINGANGAGHSRHHWYAIAPTLSLSVGAAPGRPPSIAITPRAVRVERPGAPPSTHRLSPRFPWLPPPEARRIPLDGARLGLLCWRGRRGNMPDDRRGRAAPEPKSRPPFQRWSRA
jgi:hypothetical protein